MPAISVIIPVYNVEPYLRECLDSVVNQTFRDLEIICVNDGSTDGSPAILEEYSAKDSRILIVNKENGGLNTARNAGLERVTGEYFAILDSDDWLDVTAYEKAYARAKASGADMTYFSFKCVDFPDREDVPLPNIKETVNQAENIQWVVDNMSVCWCYLWKTDFVKKNQLHFYNELKSSDEITFTYKAAVLTNKIAFVPERLSFYRYRNNSLTGKANKSRYYFHSPLAFALLFQDIALCNVSKESWLLLYSIKWGFLYGAYSDVIDKEIRPEMTRLIKQKVTNEERKFIIANEKSFDPRVFSFFVKHSGLTLFRLKYNCKRIKGKCFDWFAKRLIPYSPWLQRALETVDSQRKQIQILKEQLERSQDESSKDIDNHTGL